jgi:gamma-glutamylputrescine oxidase
MADMDRDINSYWEQDALQDIDCLIIGGGMIGLLTALEWRDTHPHDRIAVLERGMVPTGASTRNAGFACFGSLTELLSDISTVGIQATVDLVARRWQGLARLRKRVNDHAMALESHGGFELLNATQLPALTHLPLINAALHPLFGEDVFILDPEALAQAGFGSHIHALIRNRFESQIHPGRLMQALAQHASVQHIAVYNGALVSSIDDRKTHVVTTIANSGHERVLHARRVALCTNALTSKLAPTIEIAPARGQILITEPIADLPWRGCYHFEQGFYYFRNVGNRILLGGARHLDLDNERTDALILTDVIQTALENFLTTVVIPGKRVVVAQRWAGTMGFTKDKQPIVKKLSENVVVGFGCNGMGVALGGDIASSTAAMLDT